MEHSRSKTLAYAWLLAAAFSVSLAALAYPIYVIQPFRHQGPRELALALEIIQIRPTIQLVSVACALVGSLLYWRAQPARSRRILAAAGASLVCAFAALSWLNIYELMFHPDVHPLFSTIQQAKIDPDDKVLAVKLAGSARAYPIRSIAYHHIINDTVGGLPIVATY
jgi:hypothetical protein